MVAVFRAAIERDITSPAATNTFAIENLAVLSKHNIYAYKHTLKHSYTHSHTYT